MPSLGHPPRLADITQRSLQGCDATPRTGEHGNAQGLQLRNKSGHGRLSEYDYINLLRERGDRVFHDLIMLRRVTTEKSLKRTLGNPLGHFDGATQLTGLLLNQAN